VGGQTMSSSMKTSANGRSYSVINNETTTQKKTYPDVGDSRRALMRSRSGGAIIPKKVSQKYTVQEMIGAPTITNVVMNNYIATLTYSPPSSTPYGLISFYEYSLDGGMNWKYGTNSPLQMTILGLENGKMYDIIIRGGNSRIQGQPSVKYTFIAVKQVPTEIAGIDIWLDATDEGSVILSGGYVSQWNDKTTPTTNFSSSSAITYNTSDIINGRRALGFPSSGLALNGETRTISGSGNKFTLFVVFNHTVNNTGTTINSEIFMAGNTYQRFDLFSNTMSGTNLLSLNAGYSDQLSTGQVIIGSGANVISVVLDETTCSVYLNGETTLINGISKTAGSSIFYGLDGTFSWKIGGSGFIGYIGELITYPSNMGTNDRLKMEGYLAWKWGLNGKLPTNHVYKTIPPP